MVISQRKLSRRHLFSRRIRIENKPRLRNWWGAAGALKAVGHTVLLEHHSRSCGR